MGQKKNLSILEYSRLTGIKRDNLRFYDRIGLLKPEIRGENGYRYYTRRQLSSAYLISGLRQPRPERLFQSGRGPFWERHHQQQQDQDHPQSGG